MRRPPSRRSVDVADRDLPAARAGVTERLAVWSSRRAWLTLAGWAIALVAAIAIIAAFVGDALSGDEEITSHTESRRADQLQQARFADGSPDVSEVVVVRSRTATTDEPRFQRRVRAVAAQVRAAGAEQVTTFYDSDERRLVSQDRHATGMLVALGRDAEDDIDAVVDAVRATDGREGFDVTIAGEHTLDADFDTLAGEDLRTGELGFGLPVALIVLLIVFGSAAACAGRAVHPSARFTVAVKERLMALATRSVPAPPRRRVAQLSNAGCQGFGSRSSATRRQSASSAPAATASCSVAS
jgi:hypothetical protein